MIEPAPSTTDTPASAPSPSPPSRARRLAALLLGLLLVAVIAAGLWLASRPAPGQVQGMVDADSVNVAAKITARVASLAVREGARVDAGQILFELDSPEVAAKASQARAAVAAAQAVADKADEGARSEDIRAAQANWKRAVAGAELARATYRRVDNLYREGVLTRQKRDEALAQARSSDELANAARAQYDQALAGARLEDKAAAQAQVRQAEGALAEVEAAREETRGRSPQAGEVSKRMADVGELVPAGFPVFTIVDVDHPWVAFYLREDDMGGVGMGGRLRGTIPALAGRSAEFEVYFINPAGEYATWRATRQSSGYDVRSFEVRARPVEPIAGLRPGMSVLYPWPPTR
ncbi:biotin/lipoyl-binding protein [Verticiella sediminum]|uniref:Biotin/lipoyl-binding protein n=1 Tax=Verticiella sediminum TaxID=1247510 RepID=A0A556AYC4_9BURK|nr:efflux RND transporter periplasmic adaptor subunit [Verticiella sediminum]TSH97931.1 biotin/lipoyl-binding protein [Verticiella sediminum]